MRSRQELRYQDAERERERRGNWENNGDGGSNLHMEKEMKSFTASKKEKLN